MDSATSNVIPFPTRARQCMRACPSCGTHTALWRIGRLLWGHCREHEVRWVAADLQDRLPGDPNVRQMRRRLEQLSELEEVFH